MAVMRNAKKKEQKKEREMDWIEWRRQSRTKKKRVIDFFWGGDKRLWLGHVAKV